MQKPRILLIGAGQLGSRHLQAIGNIVRELSIYVVDPTESSLEVSKERYLEIGEKGERHDINFYNTLDLIDADIDVCVIATNSNVRARVTRDLLSKVSVKNIIFEKVLFQKLSDYSEMAELLNKKGVKAWVNCPRRMYSVYNDLNSLISKNANPIHFSVTGGEWGLASNAIHFIDLASKLSGASEYEIETNGMDKGFVPCKREGFIEVSGTINGRFRNGSTFSLHSLRGGEPIHTVSVTTGNNIHIIDEINLKYYVTRAEEGEELASSISFPFQSQLTNLVIESILDTGNCPLTAFSDSCNIHRPFIESLIEFSNRIKDEETDYCAIT